jgi:transcriptional regulator with XRE-family HTH domain
MSQQEVAEKLAIKRTTYAGWEKDFIPQADDFWRLAILLKVKPEDLLADGWEPDENSSFVPGAPKRKISLETIQKDLDNILHHQVWARAEIRAYGQYPIGVDARGDEMQAGKILAEIGRLAAVFAGSIAKDGIRADEHS